MPGDLNNTPNSYIDDPAFVNRFIGISRADFFAGKALYTQINAEIINFAVSYKVHFKKIWICYRILHTYAILEKEMFVQEISADDDG